MLRKTVLLIVFRNVVPDIAANKFLFLVRGLIFIALQILNKLEFLDFRE